MKIDSSASQAQPQPNSKGLSRDNAQRDPWVVEMGALTYRQAVGRIERPKPVPVASSHQQSADIIAEWKRELKAEIERQFHRPSRIIADEISTGGASAWANVLHGLGNAGHTYTYTSGGSVGVSGGVGAWVPGPTAPAPAYTHTWRVGDTYTNTATSKSWKIVSFTGSVANCVEVGGTNLASCTVQTLDQALIIGNAKLGWRVGDRFNDSVSDWTVVSSTPGGYFECSEDGGATMMVMTEHNLKLKTRLQPSNNPPAHFPSGQFTLTRDNSSWLVLAQRDNDLETECTSPGHTAYPVGQKKTFDANWAKSMSTAAPSTTQHTFKVGDVFKYSSGDNYEVVGIDPNGFYNMRNVKSRVTASVGMQALANNVVLGLVQLVQTSVAWTGPTSTSTHTWKVGDMFRGTNSGDTYTVTLVDAGAGLVHVNNSMGYPSVWSEKILSQDLASGIYQLTGNMTPGTTVVYTGGPKHGDIYRCKTNPSVWQVDGEEMECLVPSGGGIAVQFHRMRKDLFIFSNHDLQKPRDWKVGDRVRSVTGEVFEVRMIGADTIYLVDGGGVTPSLLERQIILGDLQVVTAVPPMRTVPLTCTGCLQTFPYAEPNQADGTLKCWSCRNSG